MYRSFVTCDDPKGVIECGTIRKYKSGSQKMEHKMVSHKAQKSSKTALAYKAEKEELVSKGIMEEHHAPSSVQLLEVSRGAQKLNQTIDSWSKGLSYDGQSKDIAKDLLKGALDLQESLLMLGKLQEASQYMAQLKRQKKKKLKRGRINEVGAEMMNSHQFGDQHCQSGVQKPWLSADDSSKDCINELKKAITNSLAKQNLLPNRTAREKTSYERSKKDTAFDVPSTSSSQSSVAQSSSSHSTHSISAAAPPRKEKGSNLIAKLMGLEYMPSKSLQNNPHKQVDVETDSSQMRPRPVFDIEMPKVRNPQPLINKVVSEQRTLNDILETMQFKGLLKSHSVKELKSWSYYSRETHINQWSINDISPIVLLKPSTSCLKSKEIPAPMVWEMGALKAKLKPRNVKIKEWPDPTTVDYKDRSYRTRKKQGKTEVDEPPIKRLGQEGGATDRREVVVKPEETEIKTVIKEKVAVHADKKNRKLEPEETSIKELSNERVEDLKDVVAKAEEKRVKTNLKGSSKLKASCPVTNQQQKEETTVKKVNKIQKVDTNSMKRIETEVVKPKNVSRSQDQAKVTSTKTRIENGSMTTKTQITQHSSTNKKSMSKHTTKTTAHGPKDQKKRKLVASPAAEKPTTEKVGCKEDDKEIGNTCDIDHVSKVTSSKLADQPSTEEEANVSKFHYEEHCSASQSSPCNHTTETYEHDQKDVKSSEEANDDMGGLIVEDGKGLRNGTQLNALLLSSPLFLTRAEELFDLNVNSPKNFPTFDIYDSRIPNMELCFDYANEYIERRSRVDSQTRHPLLKTYTGDIRLNLSLEKLVEEVVKGTETLTSYCSYNLPTDSLYGIMERDISGSGVVTGTWDLGWRNGFSVDEAEKTVNGIENLLVSELIEEMFT